MVLFPVSAITNATLNITLNTYSLQDALSPSGFDSIQAEDYGYITRYLFDKSCQYGGVQNCTAACQDPGSAFSTLDTLHNCMMYPIIADQYAKNNLSSDIAQLAQSLGIEKSTWPSAVSLNITNTISSCLVAYCATLEECMLTATTYNESNYDADEYNSIFTNSTGPFYFDLGPRQGGSDFDLCRYLPASVNQDIGGIGVGHTVNMELSLADSKVGICILLDPNRHLSFGVLDYHLVGRGGVLFEANYLCPVVRTQQESQGSKDSIPGQNRPACATHISIGGFPQSTVFLRTGNQYCCPGR